MWQSVHPNREYENAKREQTKATRTYPQKYGGDDTQSRPKSGVAKRAASNAMNYWSLLTRVFICFIFRFQSKYCESQTTTNIATNIAT